MDDIKHDARFVQFYILDLSHAVFLEFLGPVVDHLNYCGSKNGVRTRHRSRKLDAQNQLFLTLVKLKLNMTLTLSI